MMTMTLLQVMEWMDLERIIIMIVMLMIAIKMSMMQVIEWMDLERNAAILEKTDKAIAQKLRAANGGKVIGQSEFCTQVYHI